jgi:bifunctional non-homologous end joining protein LigD
MPLKLYRKKRNFQKTPEPEGKMSEGARQRFVVQKHDASHLHFDFRLEMDGVLKSWAVPKGPPLESKEKRLAVHVEDHPVSYIGFKGVIPEGNYGAGTVEIWDSGTYEVLLKTKKDLKIILHGKRLEGEYHMVNFKGKNWLMFKKAESLGDNPSDIKIPRSVKPMLATLTEKSFSDPDFVFETKWDGYRALAEVSKLGVRLYSRNGLNFNEKFPEIAEDLKKVKGEILLDGEIVVLDDKGSPSFQLLQDWKRDKKGNIYYYVFDILFLNGRDLRGIPLIERKIFLNKVLKDDSRIKISQYIEENGEELFKLAIKKGFEGIIAKRKNSTYKSGRSSDWQKIKNINVQEAIICGFTEPLGSREEFGALILGIYDKGELKYSGHTGGGFDEKKLREIKKKLTPLIRKTCPFENIPKTNTPASWVKPEIVVQVKFAEWTEGGLMRQPVFLGFRTDKDSKDVSKEVKTKSMNEVKDTKFSNLEKILWPKEKYTKGDLIEYYEKIAPIILPYLKDRPESLNRHPDGIGQESFFQKNIEDAPGWLKTEKIRSEGEDRDINYLICNDKDTLLYMANLGCIEINPWTSRLKRKNHPDYLILDLDPEGVEFEKVIEVALSSKKILDSAKMDAFVKTSGKTGMHIFIPLGSKYSYDQVRGFAEVLARKINESTPGEITSVERMPSERQKKIYVDYLQNRPGQTVAAPYSLRPVPGATVSTPLEWGELKKGLDPKTFNIKSIFLRLSKKGDIWRNLRTHRGINMLKSLNLLTK